MYCYKIPCAIVTPLSHTVIVVYNTNANEMVLGQWTHGMLHIHATSTMSLYL